MATRGVGREGRTFVTLIALLALAGCQVLFGVDASDLVGPSNASAGAGGGFAGQGATAGASNDGSVGGQGGAAGASGGGGAGQGGGSAGGSVEPVQDVLTAGGFHTCVRDHSVARCWGYNVFGQLGNVTHVATETATPTPALVADAALGVVQQLALRLLS